MAGHDRWASNDVLEGFRETTYPILEVEHGMHLTHGGSQFHGAVAAFTQAGTVLLVDEHGRRESFAAHDGSFLHKGVRVALREPTTPRPSAIRFTPSGSIETDNTRAKVAKASRIWVEGIHDAELIEKIWGDDLRHEAIVVEPLHGADDLATAVSAFAPSRDRRLGVLLDHLVAGSKETRIAATISREHVLIAGHPYVDVWQAIKPAAVGIVSWPTVPRGTPWKEGVIERLGRDLEPGAFWDQVLGSVASYRDIETPLVNAVERLIDFVSP